MKIGTKIPKIQMYENLHRNVNENMFSFTFLCKFSQVFPKQICYSFTLLVSNMIYNPGFPNSYGLNAFSQIQQAPGPNFRKVGKSLQCSPFIMLSLGSIGRDCVIGKSCYKETILQRNYRK